MLYWRKSKQECSRAEKQNFENYKYKKEKKTFQNQKQKSSIFRGTKKYNQAFFLNLSLIWSLPEYWLIELTCVIGAGSNPRWNESFLFTVSDNVSELNLRLMDKDTYTKDDLLGETM